MTVSVLYFASLREALGCAREEIPLSTSIQDVRGLRDYLASRGTQWEPLVTFKNLRAAVNHRMVDLNAAVNEGDEVAFFPPVTGG